MIDEELLVQRALELGLAVIDRRVQASSRRADRFDRGRGRRRVPVGAGRRTPLRREPRLLHAPGPLARADPPFLDPQRPGSPRQRPRARRARADAARRRRGDRRRRDRPLGPAGLPHPRHAASREQDPRLRRPSLLETLLALDAGIWSEPIEAGGGVHLAITLEREPSIAPPSQRSRRSSARTSRGGAATRRCAPISTTSRLGPRS